MKGVDSWQIALESYELGSVRDFRKFGSGHIHQTFLLQTDEQDYILQEFNDAVFRFPERIANNLRIISSHGGTDQLPYMLPLPIPNKDGELFTSWEGRLYRIFQFVDGQTRDALQEEHPCKLAASAFAQFVKAHLEVDASQMQETIPGFHDLALRFEQFEESLETTKLKMNSELHDMINFYQEQRVLLREFQAYVEKLPIRVTHNDTKINNLIFNKGMNAVNAVIDLDTIMGGYVFYDFGDLVRTVACTEDEGCIEWDKIDVDLPKYKALVDGYYAPLKEYLEKEELASLSFGGEMMTLIMGLRFLTDYLNGNIYYQIHYQDQNFHRSRNQQMLLKALIGNRTRIKEFIAEWIS